MKTTFPFSLFYLAALGILLLSLRPVSAQIDFAPANDLFANRIDLGSGEVASVSQGVVRASTEFGEVGSQQGDSVWWQWTAPRDGWWEVEVPASPNGIEFSTVQVFRGTGLHGLIIAGNGGVAVPNPSRRRLFLAEAGVQYQIAAYCSQTTISYQIPAGVSFTLRPAMPAANQSLAARTPLTAEGAMQWGGQGWAVHAADEPVTLPDGTVFYSPLYWSWTAPGEGTFSVETGSSSTQSYPEIKVFRGEALTEAALVDRGGFTATAGETYTIVAGSLYYASTSLAYYDVRVYAPFTGPYVESNLGSPFTLDGLFPLSVTPPAGAPRSGQLWWVWHCPTNAWIEFEGAGLSPEFKGISDFPAREAPVVFARNGKFYFWLVAGPYRLGVNGWKWPAGGSFTLRLATNPAPANDSFANALDLGTDRIASHSGGFLGSTRELGDPSGTRQIPRPTVWFRWRPVGGNGRAEVFAPGEWNGYGSNSELRVFTGSSQAFLTEIPVTWREADALTPPRWEFPVDGVYPECYLCLGGTAGSYTLNARLVGTGIASTATGYVPITEIAGVEVAEGSAIDQGIFTPSKTSWFKWTAPAGGWITWTTDARSLEVSRGPSFQQRQVLNAGAGSSPAEVTAGETLWFKCTNNPPSPISALHRLGLKFLARPAPVVPGDDPATAIDLNDQVPVSVDHVMISTTVSAAEREWSRAAVRDNLNHVSWFVWKAPAGVESCEIYSPGTVVDVFKAEPGGVRVGASIPGNSDGDAFFTVEPGSSYYFMIQTVAGAVVPPVSTLFMRSYLTSPAANDHFAAAAVITTSTTVPGTEVVSRGGDEVRRYRFGAEEGEPVPDRLHPAAIHSAWWRWTAPVAGVFRVQSPSLLGVQQESVTGTGSREFVVGVYRGEAASVAELERVPGIPSKHRLPQGSYGNPWNGRAFTFRAETGQTFLFQVASPEEYGGLSMSLAPGDAYDVWAMNQSALDPALADPDLNPAGDGFSNRLKFALGLNPALSLSADPAAERAPSYLLSPDGQSLHYTFWSDRFNTGFQLPFPANGSPALADTVRLIAEQSADMGYWSRVTDAESLGGNRWRVTLPLNGIQSRRFVRLRAEWVTNSDSVNGGWPPVVILPMPSSP